MLLLLFACDDPTTSPDFGEPMTSAPRSAFLSSISITSDSPAPTMQVVPRFKSTRRLRRRELYVRTCVRRSSARLGGGETLVQAAQRVVGGAGAQLVGVHVA